ncbi:MAG: acyltransferase, partial [Alphaproteobacteria bacterium]|nr:acyltransferase [Alphaproteobacteria bacterium]
SGERSVLFDFVSRLLQYKFVIIPLWMFETVLAAILWLPVPIYSSIVFRLVNQSRGLPSFNGMYFRALYYRFRLKHLGRNVLIDQNVFFAFPGEISLFEFSYVDKNVMIMAKSASIGKRVHLAPNVFVSGGGHLVANDFSCVATNSSIITATETLRNGSRSSGPMTPAREREMLRGKVVLEMDAFIGAGATVLPNVTVGRGSVVGAGTIVSKNTEPWSINVGPPSVQLGFREEVRF